MNPDDPWWVKQPDGVGSSITDQADYLEAMKESTP